METKNMEEIYQEVADILVNMVPEEWNRILLYAEIREGYRKVFFYYYTNNNPIYSLDIPDLFQIDEDSFESLEDDLYNCFSALWNEFKSQDVQEPWTSLTFILDNSGKMNIDYGYEDISELSPVEKQDDWEEKYLK
ncbi:immunity protein YezG family protein [Oceanobacillus kimchii]|uniref:immunity protein YezG family protein n=1 Tax=Oceanobacillus kimchii TaxID=746691 RepID=UPI003B019BC6